MEVILDDYFKGTSFIDGLKPNMTAEKIKGTLIKYIDDFAKEVNANTDSLRYYIDKEDWGGFVKYLTYDCN